MTPRESISPDPFPLTDEHRMLLHIRDTLYEGSWEDFMRDLQARAVDKPHVFETIPRSPAMKAAIAHHLTLIDKMQAWEARHQRTLHPDDDGGEDGAG